MTWRTVLASPVLHLQVLLVLAVLLGGGGVAYGTRNLLIQLFALLLLALHGGMVLRFMREAPLALRALVLATLALPLLQLIPLPPQLWQALPGRESVQASHAVAGLGDGLWFPASLDRARTLVAFTGLIAPATIIMLGSLLPQRDKVLLGWTFAFAGLAALLLGAVQLQTANTAGIFYPINAQPDVLYAVFANRNSTGLFLGLAACIAIALARPDRPRTIGAAAVIAVLLMIGVILTESRSSMALLALPLAFLLLRLVAHVLARRRNIARSISFAGAAVALLATLATGAVVYSAMQGGRVADSLARFEDQRTDRPEMWEDGLYAAGQYWPVGSGSGTFDEVFQIHESLEHVSPRRAGRAHSDWIELGLEAGLFGLALAAAWLVWVGVSGWQHLRRGPDWLGAGAAVAASCVALQSLIDYPLRNQTLLCVVGLLVILLVVRRKEDTA